MDNFPIIENSRSGEKLLELAELCKSALDRMDTCPELQELNYAFGLKRVREALPVDLQARWADVGQQYEDHNNRRHPEFRIFYEWLRSVASRRANPNYSIVSRDRQERQSRPSKLKVLRTAKNDTVRQRPEATSETPPARSEDDTRRQQRVVCPLHPQRGKDTSGTSPPKGEDSSSRDRQRYLCPLHPGLAEVRHTIYKCSKLRKLTFAEKIKEVDRVQLCRLCLRSHLTKECDFDGKCFICGGKHVKVMHEPSSSGSSISSKSGSSKSSRRSSSSSSGSQCIR